MDFEVQKTLLPEGVRYLCGTDEAGRGPLAGDVYAAAVILPDGYIPSGLNDSKKLSEKKREKLFDEICENAVSFAIATATPKEIDEINILNASLLAMRRAIAALSPSPDYLLVDGNIYRGFDLPGRAVVKGDALIPAIAAASILAKVARDRSLVELDKQYPEYCFAKHKGYPTPLHRELVQKYGPSPVHRMSFLKNILK
ncbi:MAG: ribonuclease HII [Clostridia bacterium]|nr:ribonuclease HII [Clostridia bacterium]